MAKDKYDEDDYEDDDEDLDDDNLKDDEDLDDEEEEEESKRSKPKRLQRPKVIATKETKNSVEVWQPYVRPPTYGIVNPKSKELLGGTNMEEAQLTILSKILSYAEEAAKNSR